MSPVVDLAGLAERCEEFLRARYPRRQESKAFRWGEGSDAVAILEEADPAAEARAVDAARGFQRQLWDAGLGWLTGPCELGGAGLPAAADAILAAVARGFEVPRRDHLLASLSIVAPAILEFGTPDLHQELLAALHAADLVGCQLFSEPGAGSDLAGVATRAARTGDRWRITGQKVWTSGAHYSDVGEVLCRTSDGPRHHDLTMFVIDMHAPGVEVRPLRQMTGGASFNEVFLDGVETSDRWRLGEVGAGWQVATTTLARERAALAGGGTGGGGLGLLRQERYLALVRAMGRADDANARQGLARLVTDLEVAKLNIARTRQPRGRGPNPLLLKLQTATNYQRIAAFASTMLGPALTADTGAWGTYAWSELVLAAPATRLGGGTDEIVKNAIAERVLGLPREPVTNTSTKEHQP